MHSTATDDVTFVFNPRRRVVVTRADAIWLERDWIDAEQRTGAGGWLGVAIRGGLDKGRDVLLDPHTLADLNKLLTEIRRQGRLETPGLEDLYAASREPYSS